MERNITEIYEAFEDRFKEQDRLTFLARLHIYEALTDAGMDGLLAVQLIHRWEAKQFPKRPPGMGGE